MPPAKRKTKAKPKAKPRKKAAARKDNRLALNDENVSKLSHQWQIGMNMRDACAVSDLPESSVYRWVKEGEAKVEQAREAKDMGKAVPKLNAHQTRQVRLWEAHTRARARGKSGLISEAHDIALGRDVVTETTKVYDAEGNVERETTKVRPSGHSLDAIKFLLGSLHGISDKHPAQADVAGEQPIGPEVASNPAIQKSLAEIRAEMTKLDSAG